MTYRTRDGIASWQAIDLTWQTMTKPLEKERTPMSPTTGHLVALPDTYHPVTLTGTVDDIATVSGAVRAKDQNISTAEGKQQAMVQLRELNQAERNRGRR